MQIAQANMAVMAGDSYSPGLEQIFLEHKDAASSDAMSHDITSRALARYVIYPDCCKRKIDSSGRGFVMFRYLPQLGGLDRVRVQH